MALDNKSIKIGFDERKRLEAWMEDRKTSPVGKASAREFEEATGISRSIQSAVVNGSSNQRNSVSFGTIALMAEFDGASNESIEAYIKGEIRLDQIKADSGEDEKLDAIASALNSMTLLHDSMKDIKDAQNRLAERVAALEGKARDPSEDTMTLKGIDFKLLSLMEMNMTRLGSVLQSTLTDSSKLSGSLDERINQFLEHCPSGSDSYKTAVLQIIKDGRSDLGQDQNGILYRIQLGLAAIGESSYTADTLESLLSDDKRDSKSA